MNALHGCRPFTTFGGTVVPHLAWIGFLDACATEEDGSPELFFYGCVIGAEEDAAALQWANTLAEQLVASGDALEITSVSLEPILPDVLDKHLRATKPLLSVDKGAEQLFLLGAGPTPAGQPPGSSALCAVFAALTLDEAREAWATWLQRNRPELAPTTYQELAHPIVKYGELVKEW
jgi:hypothetical protein